MASNKYELRYFPLYGLASQIRILLEDQGIDYKYNAITLDAWPATKPTTPFGKLPMLVIDGKLKISQSLTILRFLGREHGLMGNNNSEGAQIEMYMDQMADVRKKFVLMIYQDFENGRQPFIDGLVEDLAPFEKQLASNSNKQYLLLGKATAGDYALFDLLLVLVALSSTCLDALPNLKSFFQSFGSRPKLRAFLDKPEIKSMKFTGSPNL